jgi:hypothetical protein
VALVWTALMTLALAGKVRFILHITLTGLRWREFREHELPYHELRPERQGTA